MNYGESLVYWYLRFNGFFPIVDFVMHSGVEMTESTDCDLLAVRFPYVHEEIGGQVGDWDEELFAVFCPSRIIGLVVEVTTSPTKRDLRNKFSDEYLNYAVKRLGLIPTDQVADVVVELVHEKQSVRNDKVIGKVGVTMNVRGDFNNCTYFPIELSRVRDFINTRLEAYSNEKHRDRMFFSDPLIQYLTDLGHN